LKAEFHGEQRKVTSALGVKGKKMKIFNLIIEILWFITSVSLVIQDVRKWKSEKKERDFNKWLEDRRKNAKI
jgi:hypothetical protein